MFNMPCSFSAPPLTRLKLGQVCGWVLMVVVMGQASPPRPLHNPGREGPPPMRQLQCRGMQTLEIFHHNVVLLLCDL